jgi:AAA ATPase domain
VASRIREVRFVGRDEELRVLAAAYAAADGGEASLVLVGGDAGVGKTRLLAEFTGGLDAKVLRGGCLPLGATGLPFSPIVEVLRGLAGDGSPPGALPPVLARLVPGLPAQAPPGPSSQAQLFQAFLGLLERLAGPGRSSWSWRTSTGRTARPGSCWPSWPTPCAPSGLLVVATYRADDLHASICCGRCCPVRNLHGSVSS